MGFSEQKEHWLSLWSDMEKCSIVLALHEADLETTKLMEASVLGLSPR